MRRYLFILIVWFGTWASVAVASEVLLGVVASVGRDQGRVTLKVIDTSGSHDDRTVPGSLVITVDPDKIPNGLSPGDAVRVWGEYSTDSGRIMFRAGSIRKGSTGSSGNDATGVRSRLGQSGQSGQGADAGRRSSGGR